MFIRLDIDCNLAFKRFLMIVQRFENRHFLFDICSALKSSCGQSHKHSLIVPIDLLQDNINVEIL